MSKRIFIIHRVALVFFLSSLGLSVVNEALWKSKIPSDIVGYLVFASLGFYLGFHICLDEVKRMQKKGNEDRK
jgi:hypothetical protein